MKILCNNQHWEIKNGQLLLDTPDGQEAVKSMVKVLEGEIRQRLYDEICSIDFTANRTQIMKNGLENSILTAQDLIAKVVLGERKN